MWSRNQAGWSLLEALVTLLIAAAAASMAAPALGQWQRRAALAGGGARLVREVRELRWRALANGCSFAMVFERRGERWRYGLYRDGDGDGVRSADLASGVDPLVDGPFEIGRELGPIDFGLPGPIPRIPPAAGELNPRDPIQLGSTDILSVSPLGSSSSGSLYLLGPDDRVLGAVIYGPTARVRLWSYDPAARRWSRVAGPGAP